MSTTWKISLLSWRNNNRTSSSLSSTSASVDNRSTVLIDNSSNNNQNFSLLCSSKAIENSNNYSSLILIGFVVFGLIGNILVCLAILREKRLQNATNYFLFSLAVADLMVSMVVMPLNIYSEFHNGVWTSGLSICILYSSLDVLLCSVSIVHMSIIALDRYRGISEPFKARNKTKAEVGAKIVGIWILTILISCPITIISLQNPQYIYSDCLCGTFPNFNIPYFQIYGSVLTFLVPSIIMAVTYVKTVWLLRQQMALCRGQDPNTLTFGLRRNTNASLQPAPPVPGFPLLGTNNVAKNSIDSQSLQQSKKRIGAGTAANNNKRHRRNKRQKFSRDRRQGSILQVEPFFEHPSEATGVFAVQSIHSIVRNTITTETQRRRSRWMPKPTLRQYMRKAATVYFLQSRKDSIVMVSRERKATKVLGVVFFSFFFCWSPFFITNFVLAFCGDHCSAFPPVLGSIFLWLGYISSTINPIIYTIVNPLFRQTFLDLLTCRCCFYYIRRSSETRNSLPTSFQYRYAGNHIRVNSKPCCAVPTDPLLDDL